MMENKRPTFIDLTNVDETSPHVEPQKTSKWSRITRVAQDETDDTHLSKLPRECPSLESSDEECYQMDFYLT